MNQLDGFDMGRVERKASKIRRPAPPPLLDEPTLNESEKEMGGAEMHVRTDGRARASRQ